MNPAPRVLMARVLASLLLVSAFLGAGPVRAQSGLVGAYGLNEGSGTTAADVSGQNNTGTLSGAAWTASGKYGNALSFDGTSAYVSLGNPGSLQLTGSMTVSAWIYSAAFPADDAGIVSKRGSTGWELDTSLDTGSRTVGFKLSNASGSSVKRYGATVLQANQWYHVAGVYDAQAQTMTVYLNGVLDNGALTGTVPSSQQNTTLTVNIGRKSGSTGYEFNGRIDEVRIYNRALSQGEIQADMGAPIPPTTGLVGAYGFAEGSGTTTADASGLNNTGTLNGADWTAAGQYAGALVFDGATAYVDLGNPSPLRLTGSMTLSAWIYSAAFPDDDAPIVSKRVPAGAGWELDTAVETGPRTLGFKLSDPSGASVKRFGATVLQLNQWVHVAGVYDAQARTMNVYLNGVLDNGTLTAAVPSSQQDSGLNVNLGRKSGDSSYAFNGAIDEVRIYHRALSQAEIQADMNTPVGGSGDTTPPSAPSGLSAGAVSATQINLAWTASTDNVGVTGYRVERCTGTGCSSFALIASVTGASFNDTGLAASTSYSYRVQASDAAGNLSAYSGVAGAATQALADTTPPTAPTALSASVASASRIDLTWTASTDNVAVAGYQIDRCQGAGCSAFTQIATSSLASFSDTGLSASTTYRYQVRATDAAGNVSANSSSVTATTQAAPDTSAPSAPAGLAASAAGTGQINLAWSASSDDVGVTGYRVERCQGAGCASFVQIATPAGTSYSDSGLAPATSYSYRVRAADAAGNLSAYSNVASAATQAGQLYYIVPDHLNTPRLIANQQGTTVWKWDNAEPFGNSAPNDNPSGLGTFDFPLRFPGQYFDSETGLFYNLNRDYDPGTGRYPESDPIGLGGGINTYVYVLDPLTQIDPEGLMGRAPGGRPGGPSSSTPAAPPAAPVSCDGEWSQRGFDEQLPKVLRLCTCYWLCIPCRYPAAWSGNKRDLPSTGGQLFYDSTGGALKTGNNCICKNKPGPETGCKSCPPKPQ